MEKREQAVNIKHSGKNCAQAVLCAFADELDMSEDELAKLGAAFGIGMGTMEGTCGALVGAQMINSLRKYEGRPITRDAAAYMNAFKQACGATVCRDLKGVDTGTILCECDDCVRHAVDLVENI